MRSPVVLAALAATTHPAMAAPDATGLILDANPVETPEEASVEAGPVAAEKSKSVLGGYLSLHTLGRIDQLVEAVREPLMEVDPASRTTPRRRTTWAPCSSSTMAPTS